MAQLRRDYPRFASLNTEILVVGPDPPESFQQYWSQEHLPFPGLPDPERKVLQLYGQEIHLFKLGRMPAQMLIDAAGLFRFVHYGNSMADIPVNDEIIQLLGRLNLS